MNIKIIAVGKTKEKYWADGIDEYLKRLSRYGNVSIMESKESPQEDNRQEGEEILKKIRETDYVITLEIKGEAFSSEDLAEKIKTLGVEGQSNIVFVIGGSTGLSEEVLSRKNLGISFSNMTFPHQMMRVILVEQIYRSFKIIKGEKYHK